MAPFKNRLIVDLEDPVRAGHKTVNATISVYLWAAVAIQHERANGVAELLPPRMSLSFTLAKLAIPLLGVVDTRVLGHASLSALELRVAPVGACAPLEFAAPSCCRSGRPSYL